MKEKFWIITSAFIGILALITVVFFFSGNNSGSQASNTNDTTAKNSTPATNTKPVLMKDLSATPQPFSWGDVKIDGGIVETKFTLKNTTGNPVKISKIETSCMCTEASLKIGDNTSPFFGMPGHAGVNSGWQADLTPQNEGTMTVKFDPAAHGPSGLGKIDRVVRIWFSEPANTYFDINFSATVVK